MRCDSWERNFLSGSSINWPVITGKWSADVPHGYLQNEQHILLHEQKQTAGEPSWRFVSLNRQVASNHQKPTSWGPPTFPVLLSGCQAAAQVNDDEWSPPPPHACYLHTRIQTRSSRQSNEHHNQGWKYSIFGISHVLLLYHSFICRILSAGASSLPPLFFLCVFSSQASSSQLSSGNDQDLGCNVCLLGWTFLLRWQLEWWTGLDPERLSDWQHNAILYAKINPALEQEKDVLLRKMINIIPAKDCSISY